jgi:hypothetical protein
VTVFFVPNAEPQDQEQAYLELTSWVNAAVPGPTNRVYSITWKHDGTEWTATVGKQLNGTQTITKGRGRQQRTMTVPRSSSDTVLAIFLGVPFIIVHDDRSRTWNQPIYAGSPSRIVHFSQ